MEWKHCLPVLKHHIRLSLSLSRLLQHNTKNKTHHDMARASHLWRFYVTFMAENNIHAFPSSNTISASTSHNDKSSCYRLSHESHWCASLKSFIRLFARVHDLQREAHNRVSLGVPRNVMWPFPHFPILGNGRNTASRVWFGGEKVTHRALC